MKYNDWLAEEVLKALTENLATSGATYHTQGTGGGRNTIYTPDDQRVKDPDEEEMKHDRLEERPSLPQKKEVKLSWETLPMPKISEIAWSEPDSSERQEMAAFLNKIGGDAGDLPSKLQAIRNVVNDGFPPGTKMDTILSYLVFLKTLTYIIQSFNSSSAGFTFESFLGVLLGGEQIATGQNTIADYKTGSGEYISLKLLTQDKVGKSGSTIDGSFRQLIDDLSGTSATKGDRMKYVIALKDFTGEGKTLGGTVSFYEFEVNYETFEEFMQEGAPESQKAIQLLSDRGYQEWYNPKELKAHKEELDSFLPAFLSAASQLDGEERAMLHKAFNAKLSKKQQEFSQLSPEKLAKAAWTSLQSGEFERGAANIEPLTKTLKRALKDIWELQNKNRDTRKDVDKRRSSSLDYLSTEESLKKLRSLRGDPKEYFKYIKERSRGYLFSKQFQMRQGPVLAKKFGSIEIGSLAIGREQVEKALQQSVNDVNERMFAAFNKMNSLATSLQDFFLQGLKDKDGDKAIAASSGVSKDVGDIKKKKK